MSFADSPSLVLERQPQTEAVLVYATAVAALVSPWLAWVHWVSGLLGVCVLAIVLASWYRFGSIGARRCVVHAKWDAEGQWWLTDGTGRRFESSLDPDTRVFGAFAWLRWRSEYGVRHMLLWRGSLSPVTNRQLSARLRLQKLEPGHLRPTSSDTPVADVVLTRL